MDYRMKEVEKMKCPKCEDGKIFKFKANKTGAHALAPTKCKHCHGTGKLEEGAIWLCLMPDGETRMPLSLRNEYDDYFVWREYDAYYEIDTVTPLTCLVEVE